MRLDRVSGKNSSCEKAPFVRRSLATVIQFMSDVLKVQRCTGYLIYITLDVGKWGDTESIVPWMVLEERSGHGKQR